METSYNENSIPNELIEIILNNMTYDEMIAFCLSNKRVNTICQNNAQLKSKLEKVELKIIERLDYLYENKNNNDPKRRIANNSTLRYYYKLANKSNIVFKIKSTTEKYFNEKNINLDFIAQLVIIPSRENEYEWKIYLKIPNYLLVSEDDVSEKKLIQFLTPIFYDNITSY